MIFNKLKQFLLSLMLLLIATSAIAAENFSFKISDAVLDTEGFNVTITAIVKKDYMLYRNQMSVSSIGSKTQVNWPQSKRKKDPYGPGTIEVYDHGIHEINVKVTNSDANQKHISLKLNYQGCSSETCFMPETLTFELKKSDMMKQKVKTKNPNKASSKEISSSKNKATNKVANKDTNKEAASVVQTPDGPVDFKEILKNDGIIWVLLLALLGGLLVSLTPCVYPMIPITLSIIGSREENTGFWKGFALSATYVAGLSLVYAILGMIAASFGAQVRGIIQGVMFQAFISIAFFLLALSMFDVFMLQVPAFLRNKLGNTKKGGLGSIFVMGMLSGIMASPCVAAPLAGILAFIAVTGSKFMGFFMLLFFAWGMSVPLLFIGAFSGSINSLPKAGNWMNKIKEFYGFMLFGASLYFAKPIIGEAFSDLAIGMLLVTFAAFLGLYDSVDDADKFYPKVFKGFGVLSLVLACAFALSGAVRGKLLHMPSCISPSSQFAREAEYWNDSYEKAKLEAKQSGKPIFVDFRADWCSICKELEHTAFKEPKISVLFKKMILLKVDATNPNDDVKALLERYKVVGLPTLLVLDKDGNELTSLRMVGSVTTEQLEKNLRKAL